MRLSDWSAACGDGAPDEVEPDEAPSDVFAVCDCGISRMIAVDEDGLCAACGASPIIAADLGSAEAASDLIEDGEAAATRAEAAERRAEAAEQRAEALAAELAQARADARVLAGIAYGLESNSRGCDMFDRLLLISMVLLAGCETQENAKRLQPVQWEAISPPRPDLECWRSHYHSGTYVIECWPVGGPMCAVERDVVGAAGGAR